MQNTNTSIDKGRVQEFESKVRDLNNIIGVIISASGFQEGARAFAKEKGIMTLQLNELPNFFQLIALQLKRTLLPDSSFIRKKGSNISYRLFQSYKAKMPTGFHQ